MNIILRILRESPKVSKVRKSERRKRLQEKESETNQKVSPTGGDLEGAK